MSGDELKKIIADHLAWLQGKAEGKRANLCSANLCGADLCSANLCNADLCSADLRGADLRGADLCGADLCGANLCSADLCNADLGGADLCGANLCGADLCGANLCGADLRGANLCGATNISPITNAQTLIVPESGPFFGWKKCQNGVLVQVAVGNNARRSNSTGRKCRAEYVKVLQVIGAEVGISNHNGKTEYRKGAIVRCDKWEEDRWQECAGGIHFFLTRKEAESY